MATEIYIRKPNKKNYNENDVEISDSLEIFLQEIEMVMGTPPTSVLGNPTFGVGLYSYLHSFKVSDSDLIQVINQQIQLNCPMASEFTYSVSVEFYKINNSDTAIIDILVEKDSLVRIVAN